MKSRSPYNEIFEIIKNDEREKLKIDNFIDVGKKTVVVQGIGFVGSAMIAALSQAKNEKDELLYNVIGIDLADENNFWKIARVNEAKAPVVSSDHLIDEAFKDGVQNGNILATYSDYAFQKADIVVIDINLDIIKNKLGDSYDYEFTYGTYKKAVAIVAKNISADTLVIIESTVPPGTTENVLFPIFKKQLELRNLDINELYLAHSYERVMPGKDYLNSITNYYRVFSGIDRRSAEKAKQFLESFINIKDYPLYELHSTNASEMSKVLENSFRAMNIAFMQEWTEFAEQAGVNLFEVINAIRVRPTHKNIMQPGFGVGGYCLTKDSLLADWAYNNLFGSNVHLDMSLNAIATNDLMPTHTYNLLKTYYDDLTDLKITMLGISYLNDVADTRYTPAELFYNLCQKEGAKIFLHDPLVEYWQEKDKQINNDLNYLKELSHDVAVFTVKHTQYMELSAEEIGLLLPGVKLIIDANNIINDKKAKLLKQKGIDIVGVGKGHWKIEE